MRHYSVSIETIHASALSQIDPTDYDSPYLFSNRDLTLALQATHTHSGTVHIPVHYFLPWGLGFDMPVLRQYNLYLQKNYFGDIYFYSLQHIKLTHLNSKQSILEEFAHRWLRAQLDKGIIKTGQPVLIEGTSLGGAIASVIAALAADYKIVLGNLNIFEPAGMSKRSPLTMFRSISSDAKRDYIDAFGSHLRFQSERALMFIKAVRNGQVQARFIQEISKGNLARYINEYLRTQSGEVHIGHGADSTFMTLEDLDVFSEQLIAPERVASFDFIGCPHGFGGKALGLSDWYGKHTSKHQ